jgi:hypothetical protein
MVREHKIPMLNLAIERVVSRGMATSKEVMLLVTLFRSAINAIESKSYNINANPAKDIQ